MIENNELVVRMSFLQVQSLILGKKDYLFVKTKEFNQMQNRGLELFAMYSLAEKGTYLKVIESEVLSFHPAMTFVKVKPMNNV
jgi:hypothetical protein